MKILWHTAWQSVTPGEGFGIPAIESLTDEQYEAAKRELMRRWPSDAAAEQAARDFLAEIRRQHPDEDDQ